MQKIKFGTDGWRAIIALDFTVENVQRVAYATAVWLKEHYPAPTAVVGNDPRFGGRMFAETTARVLAYEGITVYLAVNEFVSTPMISLGTVKLKTTAGIIITASHNPPEYNGYKIKAYYGGPATPEMIELVEDNIPDKVSLGLLELDEYKKSGLIKDIDLEEMYLTQVRANFDMSVIEESGMRLAYDAMFGAGKNVMRDLLPDLTFLHTDVNPGFEGQAPEPIDKNLTELRELLQVAGDMDGALVTDGDADRIGMYDGEGNFIDSHHLLLLLIHYMVKYKGEKGAVITTFSTTSKIAQLCKAYDLPHTTTKIGFKYICDLIVNMGDEFLVGGEESGGIAIRGHIPERDGIWIGLIIWEFMAKSGKSLPELIQEIYAVVGSFAVERYDLHLTEEKKQEIIASCKAKKYTAFGTYQVESIEDMDGYKFHLGDSQWVMMRPSGTEPVLRVYAEAADSEAAFAILDIVKETVLA